MKLEAKSQRDHRIVGGVSIGALALLGGVIGCTVSVPSETSTVESGAVNSCNAADSSHTIAPAITCTFNVGSSSNDGAAITAGTPRKKDCKWVVDCYLSGITCGGARNKTPLSCPSPEYLATNQDVNCSGAWSRTLKGFQGTVVAAEDDSILSQPSSQRALALCTAAYGSLLNDLNATANNMCNAVATTWTNESKKSAVCCIPAPPPPGGGTKTTGSMFLGELVDAGIDADADAGADADAEVPGDGGTTCSASDPDPDVDETVPPDTEE